jgi:hypothetical protein
MRVQAFRPMSVVSSRATLRPENDVSNDLGPSAVPIVKQLNSGVPGNAPDDIGVINEVAEDKVDHCCSIIRFGRRAYFTWKILGLTARKKICTACQIKAWRIINDNETSPRYAGLEPRFEE